MHQKQYLAVTFITNIYIQFKKIYLNTFYYVKIEFSETIF